MRAAGTTSHLAFLAMSATSVAAVIGFRNSSRRTRSFGAPAPSSSLERASACARSKGASSSSPTAFSSSITGR